MWPLSSAPVWRGGLGAAVTLVSTLHVQSMWSIHDNTLPPPSAVCSPDCVNGGTCVAPNHCTCPPGWTGATCSQGAWGSKVHRWGVLRVSFFFLSAATCSPPCQNGGSCISPDSCVCTQSWMAPDCSHRKFNNVAMHISVSKTNPLYRVCVVSLFSCMMYRSLCEWCTAILPNRRPQAWTHDLWHL